MLFAFFCGVIYFFPPVYPAGESPREGISHETLVTSMRRHGHRNAAVLDDLDNLSGAIRELARPGALVVCLGAGSITAHSNALAEKLAAG